MDTGGPGVAVVRWSLLVGCSSPADPPLIVWLQVLVTSHQVLICRNHPASCNGEP